MAKSKTRIYFGLLEKVKNRHKNYPIYLTIYHNWKQFRYRTEVEIPSIDCWNAIDECVYAKAKTPDAPSLNQKLKDLKELAEKAQKIVEKSGEEVTAKAIMEIFRQLQNGTYKPAKEADKPEFSFFEYAEKHLLNLYDSKQYGLYQRQSVFLKKLKCFVNGIKPEAVLMRSQKNNEALKMLFTEDLLFTDITLSFLKQYDSYLHKVPNQTMKGLLLNQSTIKKEMEIFRAIYTQGLKDLWEEGLNIERNPFVNGYTFKGNAPKEKAKLSEAEIDALEALELPEYSALWNARNCFLFAYYAGGIRFGDNIQIRGSFISKETTNEGYEYRLKYTMDKTGKKINRILIPEALEILGKYIDIDNPSTDYVFPYLDNNALYAKAKTPEEKKALSADETKLLKQAISAKNALLNKELKILADKAGISKHLSTHTARHSCADTLRREGVPMNDIKDTLAQTSTSTTEMYVSKTDTHRQDEAIMLLSRKGTHQQESKSDALLKQLQQLDKDTLKALLEKLNG